MQRDSITWFEIPSRDLDRAQRFYEAVLATPLRRERIGEAVLAVFPYADGGVSGCLHQGPGTPAPGSRGTLVYLDASPSLDAALARAGAAGGQVVTPKTALPPGMGFFAHIEDIEGNRVGLHAPA
jgi:predicted enzyme related to lactoylglutathione lyase